MEFLGSAIEHLVGIGTKGHCGLSVEQVGIGMGQATCEDMFATLGSTATCIVLFVYLWSTYFNESFLVIIKKNNK